MLFLVFIPHVPAPFFSLLVRSFSSLLLPVNVVCKVQVVYEGNGGGLVKKGVLGDVLQDIGQHRGQSSSRTNAC